jgi:cytoskeletal protein CcmA (bactofilin family)
VTALGSALRYLGLRAEDETGALGARPSAVARDGAAGAVMGAGLAFRGDVTGEGDFHIAGKFEGEISVSGRVVVADGAHVDANITAHAIVIGGTVRGNLSAATRVEILPTGVLTGTLKTGSFSAADGASMKGEVWVDPPNRTAPAAPAP